MKVEEFNQDQVVMITW